jgi:hypothetical protein
MTYQFDSYNYLVRLQKGESLKGALNELAKKEDLKSAWLQGVGGAKSVTLGYYNLPGQEYLWQDFNELLEITSLSGNLSWVGDEPFWHIHGVFGGKDYQSIGGHVKDLSAGATVELFIHPFRTQITRTKDAETGLKLLYI